MGMAAECYLVERLDLTHYRRRAIALCAQRLTQVIERFLQRLDLPQSSSGISKFAFYLTHAEEMTGLLFAVHLAVVAVAGLS